MMERLPGKSPACGQWDARVSRRRRGRQSCTMARMDWSDPSAIRGSLARPWSRLIELAAEWSHRRRHRPAASMQAAGPRRRRQRWHASPRNVRPHETSAPSNAAACLTVERVSLGSERICIRPWVGTDAGRCGGDRIGAGRAAGRSPTACGRRTPVRSAALRAPSAGLPLVDVLDAQSADGRFLAVGRSMGCICGPWRSWSPYEPARPA